MSLSVDKISQRTSVVLYTDTVHPSLRCTGHFFLGRGAKPFLAAGFCPKITLVAFLYELLSFTTVCVTTSFDFSSTGVLFWSIFRKDAVALMTV